VVDRLRLPGGEVEGLFGAVTAQQQPGEQQHLAADRQLQIEASGTPRSRSAVLHDQPIGREAHGAEAKVEAQCVGGDDQQQIAGQRQLPERPEAQPLPIGGEAAVGKGRRATPEHGSKAQPGAGQRIAGAPAHTLPEPRQLQRWRRLQRCQQRRRTG